MTWWGGIQQQVPIWGGFVLISAAHELTEKTLFLFHDWYLSQMLSNVSQNCTAGAECWEELSNSRSKADP